MIRYYVYATDSLANSSRMPAFDNPDDSPEYQGTVVLDPAVTSTEPILQMFVQNPTLATNYTGTRCSALDFFPGIRGYVFRGRLEKQLSPVRFHTLQFINIKPNGVVVFVQV